MGIPRIYVMKDGERKTPMDIDVLEKIQFYLYARPLAKAIIAIRELKGRIEVLEHGVDGDGRMRFTWNVVGTETGRWSSTKNPCGGGGNGQNITDELREPFIADEGKKLGHIDLEELHDD